MVEQKVGAHTIALQVISIDDNDNTNRNIEMHLPRSCLRAPMEITREYIKPLAKHELPVEELSQQGFTLGKQRFCSSSEPDGFGIDCPTLCFLLLL